MMKQQPLTSGSCVDEVRRRTRPLAGMRKSSRIARGRTSRISRLATIECRHCSPECIVFTARPSEAAAEQFEQRPSGDTVVNAAGKIESFHDIDQVQHPAPFSLHCRGSFCGFQRRCRRMFLERL